MLEQFVERIIESMPGHDRALLAVGILLGMVLVGMLIIDWLHERRNDHWFGEFEAPDHLAESEAAAIAHQHQPQ